MWMPGKRWTPEEDAFLKEKMGKLSIKRMAQKLNRTPIAVRARIYNLGLGRTAEASGLLTVSRLAKSLNVDKSIVDRWVNSKGLKTIKRVTSMKQRVNLIDPVEFWKWAEQNKDLIDFSRIEPNAIPPEPEWVKDARKAKPKRSLKPWTTNEVAKMKQLRRMGKTYQEIAEILGRTKVSVELKYRRLMKEEKRCVRSTG